jgi:hypothetical protein
MRRSSLVCLVLLSFTACKKSSTGLGTGDDMMTPDAPATDPGGSTYSLQWGPATVQPNIEDTQCVILNLKNANEIKVHEIHDMLSTFSHHMIVYRDDMDTTEQTTPVDCQPFTGALNTTGMIQPLTITQKTDDDVILPDGVAYTFHPNQMIKIELHYINTGDIPAPLMGNVTFVAADASTIMAEAGLLFTGSPDIDVLPNTTTTLHEFFAIPADIDLSKAHIFAITGHEHHLGTNVQVSVAPSPSGPFTPVYNPTNFTWSEPPTQQQSPDFSVPAGGGFDFTCTWVNNTANEVKFGEKTTDEMCFFWAYYWPAPTSEVCVHTDKNPQTGQPYDLCCPSQDSLCALLPIILK